MIKLTDSRTGIIVFCWMLSALLDSPVRAQESNIPTSFDSPSVVSEASYQAPRRRTSRFEVGRPNKLIDGVGWVLGVPHKIILWDRRADDHRVSDETQDELAEYVAAHQLDSVKVRINQYDPGGEWRRLVKNKRVGAGWRYTVGALTTLSYTIFPGRLLGSDSYNPYTDTLNIYSDIPSLALEQAAYARDVHQRQWPGTYATLQGLPIVGLWHESHTKQDVHNFLADRGTPDEQAEAHRILNPQLGSEIGGQVGMLVPGAGLPLQFAGAAIGHVFGRHRANAIPTE